MAMMHRPRRLLLLLAAVSALSSAATAEFSNHTCSAARNYTDSSPYGNNVAELRSALSSLPPATAGNYWWFRSRTVGQVSGLAMCYADADAKECLASLNSVNNSWYSDLCDHSRSLGYLSSVGLAYGYAPSGDSSGGTSRLILTSYFVAYGAGAAAMRKTRLGLLGQLADRAGGDALRFAAGSQGYNDTTARGGAGAWQVMYGMAQCALDLAPSECSSCLVDLLAATYTVERVTNSTSAQLMELTCYLRYQIDKPINFIPGMVPAVPPAAPPAAPTGSAAAPAPPTLPLVVAALLAAVTLFISVSSLC